MEKSVNSHVGRVMVAKVINQKSKPGMMLTRNRMDWPNEADMNKITLLPCGRFWATWYDGAAVAGLMIEVKLRATRLTPCARVGEAPAVSMVEYLRQIRPCSFAEWSASCHAAAEARRSTRSRVLRTCNACHMSMAAFCPPRKPTRGAKPSPFTLVKAPHVALLPPLST